MKKYIVSIASLILLIVAYLLLRYPLFHLHGMKKWPFYLFAVGFIVIAVSGFGCKSKMLPLLTVAGYILGFLVERQWPGGTRKEKLQLDLWAKDVAPSPELFNRFRREKERFGQYASFYYAELDANPAAKALACELKAVIENLDVLLLYTGTSANFDPALILMEWLMSQMNGKSYD